VSRAALTQASEELPADLSIEPNTTETSECASKPAQQPSDPSGTRKRKVAQIKKRMEDGTYTVPIELLAQKLIDGRRDGC